MTWRAPTSFTVPWAGLALGPLAWSIATMANYAVLEWACRRGFNPTAVVAGLCALVSVLGAVSSGFAWSRVFVTPVPEHDGRPYNLLAAIGVGCGILFAFTIIVQGVAGLLLHPCLR